MPRLATPVMYESALAGLNDIRPLELGDECRNAVSYPVGTSNPIDTDRPAIGKLVRCNEQGSLLRDIEKWAIHYEYIIRYSSVAVPLFHITFARRVKGVIVKYENVVSISSAYWCDVAGDIHYVRFTSTVFKFLPFVGRAFNIHCVGMGDWNGIIYLYGFY